MRSSARLRAIVASWALSVGCTVGGADDAAPPSARAPRAEAPWPLLLPTAPLPPPDAGAPSTDAPSPDIAPGTCGPGLTDCVGYCADLRSDPYHCGACDVRCENGQVCAEGRCAGAAACAATSTLCGNYCADLRTDPGHCGRCSQRCPDGVMCVDGRCAGSGGGPSTPAPTAAGRSCEPEGAPGCGHVVVRGGTFTMGDLDAREAAPLRPAITVDDFALDTYEVTVARFRRFWEAGHPAPDGAVAYPGGVVVPWEGAVTEPPRGGARTCMWSERAGDAESRPINCVDWYTAQAFCVWDGGRLPTEAEWEWAARGPDARAWVWGSADVAREVCWLGATARPGAPCRVDDPGYRVDLSPFGAAQMAGNVTEWTADRWSAYAELMTASRNPVALPPSSTGRVTRGGSWDDDHLVTLRAASRAAHGERDDYACLGFRCARALP